MSTCSSKAPNYSYKHKEEHFSWGFYLDSFCRESYFKPRSLTVGYDLSLTLKPPRPYADLRVAWSDTSQSLGGVYTTTERIATRVFDCFMIDQPLVV